MSTYIAFYNTNKEKRIFDAVAGEQITIYVKNAEVKQGDVVYVFLYGKNQDGLVAKGIALNDSTGDKNKKTCSIRIDQSVCERDALASRIMPIDRSKLYIARKEGERKKDSAFKVCDVSDELTELWEQHIIAVAG